MPRRAAGRGSPGREQGRAIPLAPTCGGHFAPMYTQVADVVRPVASAFTTTLTRSPDPEGGQQADRLLGTLHPDAVPGSVPVRDGLHFLPAWDPTEEALARVRFLDLSTQEAARETLAEVRRAARKRALHGVSWRYERVTVRVVGAGGETLACRSVGGVASDQPKPLRAELERDLTQEALADAQDWAILGLNRSIIL